MTRNATNDKTPRHAASRANRGVGGLRLGGEASAMNSSGVAKLLLKSRHTRSEAEAQSSHNQGQNQLVRTKQYEPDLARLEKKLARLEQQEREIRQQMMKP